MKSEIQTISDSQAVNYVLISALTLFVFDSLLTLPAEIKYVWKVKRPITNLLYFTGRYGCLGYFTCCVFNSGFIFWDARCRHGSGIGILVPKAAFITLNCLATFGSQGLLLLRIYGIAHGMVACLAAVLFIGSLVIQILGYILFTCPGSGIPASFFILSLISNMCFIAFDLLVFATALQTCWRILKFRNIFRGKTLTELILLQGLIRFSFMLLWTTGDSVQLAPILHTRRSIVHVDVTLQEIFTTLIVCRFLLDLRQRNDSTNRTLSLNDVAQSTRVRSSGLGTTIDWIRKEVMDDFREPNIPEGLVQLGGSEMLFDTIPASESPRYDNPHGDPLGPGNSSEEGEISMRQLMV